MATEKNDKDSVKVESKKVEPKPMAPVAGPLITFDRWFATIGKPAHWKKGMQAFANAAGRKTPQQWTTMFKDY